MTLGNTEDSGDWYLHFSDTRPCRFWSKGAAGSASSGCWPWWRGRAKGRVPRCAAAPKSRNAPGFVVRRLLRSGSRIPRFGCKGPLPCTSPFFAASKVCVSGTKYIIGDNPRSLHNTSWPRTLPSAWLLSRQREELANPSTAPSATPASTLPTSHKLAATTPGRLPSPTYRRAGGSAGGVGWPAGSEVTSSSTTSPGSPCAYMVRAALCRTWSAPAERPAGQTAGQTRRACGELRAGQAWLRGCSPPCCSGSD